MEQDSQGGRRSTMASWVRTVLCTWPVLRCLTSLRNTRMKLANGLYTGNSLPDELCGSFQKPDFVWATQHQISDDFCTVSLDGYSWCECVGEGKPLSASDNHSLRQCIMAGAACLYHQISLHETSPQMLIFAINGPTVEFLQMRAEPAGFQTNPDLGNTLVTTMDQPVLAGGFPRQWKLIYTPVSDFSIDLQKFEGCLQFRGLTSALIAKDALFHEHVTSLWRDMEGQTIDRWWVSRQKNTAPSLSQSRSMSSLPGTPSGGGSDHSHFVYDNAGNQISHQPANADPTFRPTGNVMRNQMKKFGLSMRNTVNRIFIACRSVPNLLGLSTEKMIDMEGITA